MRWAPLTAGWIAVLAALRAAVLLADPADVAHDLQLLTCLALAALFGFLAIALLARPAWWRWWFPAAWLGCGLAALALAYKDAGGAEFRTIGPIRGATDVLLHLLIAPLELGLGFAVGFVEPRAPLYVLACLAATLLGAELIRRRLWPRERGERVSAGSSAGR